MFKIGDKVRRKKDSPWGAGDGVYVVDYVTQNGSRIMVDTLDGSWTAAAFELVEPAEASDKPMGPIERLLTQDIHSGTYVCVSIRKLIENGHEYDSTGRRIVLDAIDQAIAAEQAAMSKPIASGLTERERYAIDQHDITCDHLAIGNSPEDEGDTLLEAVSEIHYRMVTANKRAEAAEKDIADLRSKPHDYDLLKMQVAQYESELRAAEELNRKWRLDYDSLKNQLRESEAYGEGLKIAYEAVDESLKETRAEIESQAVQLKNAEYNANDCHVMLAELTDENERLTNENAIFKAENDMLKQSSGKAAMLEREVERLESENERLRAANETAARNDVPRAAIECILNTICGVLLANGMRPRDFRPVHDVTAWLDGTDKVQS